MQQAPENQKNLFLAIALSIAVLFIWQHFYMPKKPKLATTPQQQQTQGAPGTSTTAQPGVPAGGTSTGIPAPTVSQPPAGSGTTAATGTPVAAMTREAALKAAPRVAIATPSLQGSVSLKGGRIDDLTLVKYHETVDPKSANVVLFSPSQSPHPYFAEYGWIDLGGASKLPGPDTVWTSAGGKLTDKSPLVMTWDNGAGLKFRRTISVDNSYMFTIRDDVTNSSGAAVTIQPYARVSRFGTPKVEGFYILHEGLIGVLGKDATLREVTYSSAIKEKIEKSQQTNGWLGITDKYWAAALIPPRKQEFTANLFGAGPAADKPNQYHANYTLSPMIVPPGASKTTEGQLFAGAKRFQYIQDYQDKFGIEKFDKLVDWGWFWYITKPLFWLIDWLYKLLGNFGLAILATTVLVKAAFFPLANKSYESMSRMKKLQPEMEKLKERCGDDKMRLQQEMMKLYKEEKINPMSGCLPILLQIPVFFALYKVLFVTIDMRHAPFYGWIKDLSAPDPTSMFNLFGLLPFGVPQFLMVGVWPLIMGATMWVQMQLNPQQPDPIQQKIFNWMPVMFTFLLASFPAGLVIYWAWNNLLSIFQQSLIMKKNGVEIPLLKNLGLDKYLGKEKSKVKTKG